MASARLLSEMMIMPRSSRMMIISLGSRAEAILPREEQIPGEVYRPGSVIRADFDVLGHVGVVFT